MKRSSLAKCRRLLREFCALHAAGLIPFFREQWGIFALHVGDDPGAFRHITSTATCFSSLDMCPETEEPIGDLDFRTLGVGFAKRAIEQDIQKNGNQMVEPFKFEGLLLEKHGRWYCPPIASLITAGGRLLLAMLEKAVADRNGTYLFCDTDSMCIVATESGGAVNCDEPAGSRQIHALSWKEVRSIQHQFRRLNPYNPRIVTDLLKIEDVNFDSDVQQRQLFGYAISAKRYALYERGGDDLNIVDPKAHGLGYLYPPIDHEAGGPDWTFGAWDWLLRSALGLPNIEPSWFSRPAMMQIRMSTPHVLKRLNRMSRPYSFVLCPLIDSVAGYPAGVDREQFALIAPFTKNRNAWLNADYLNVYDGKHYSLAFEQTPRLYKVIPQTFGFILRLYLLHPEHKSLAPDGTPCTGNTCGLLRRMHVVASQPRYIGKETDRKWDQGGDLSLLQFKPAQFDELGKMAKADPALIEQIEKAKIKVVAR